MASASKESLEKLHEALANELADGIREQDVTIKTFPDGTVQETRKRNAALLSVARQFLNDNNIQAVPTNGNGLGKLVEALKAAPPDEDELRGMGFGSSSLN